MAKHFTLIVEYLSGECAFATDKSDLIQALAEFDEARRSEFSGAIGDKCFALPEIVSARLIKTYYVKEPKQVEVEDEVYVGAKSINKLVERMNAVQEKVNKLMKG